MKLEKLENIESILGKNDIIFLKGIFTKKGGWKLYR